MSRAFLIAGMTGLLLLGGCNESLSDRAFGQRVRAYLLEHPEVLREMAQALDEKESKAALAERGAALDKQRAKLERDKRDFVANPGGKITVTQFYDYNCSYCKLAAPDVSALIAERKDVRFVFKELPIIGGPASQRGSRIALALKEQGGDYLGLYHDFFAARPLDNAAIDRITAARGLDARALEAFAEKAKIDQHLIDNRDLAMSLGIQGTPTFIVGDEIIEGAQTSQLRAAIDKTAKS